MSHDERLREADDFRALDDIVSSIKTDEPGQAESAAAQQNLLIKLDQIRNRESILMTLVRTTRNNKRFGLAFATAAVVIIAIIIATPFGSSTAHAYSAVVKQLRDVEVVSFQFEWKFDPNGPPTQVKMAFRKPALQRMELQHAGTTMVQIYDTDRRQGLLLMPDGKVALKMNMDSMPSAEKERLALLEMLGTTLKDLPEKADAVETGRSLGNRQLAGFRVGNTVYWVELEAQRLVEIERRTEKNNVILSNFEFDPPALDESQFSIEPPPSYQLMSPQAANVTTTEPGEKDLVQYLRYCSQMIQGQQFPSTINPMEILSLQKEGKLVPNTQSGPELQQFIQGFSQASASAVKFVAKMRPENDWHYAGKDAAFGQTGKPIAWWKPTGQSQYRVLWADLTLTEGQPPATSN